MALPDDFYPESVAAGPDGTLYVSSWRQGAIARVSPGSRTAEIFVSPGSNGLSNGQGVLVDGARQLLWVCSGDLGYTVVPRTPSALKAYDLATGAPRRSLPMPEGGYCNDLALDAQGRLYVTDSRHPWILRLAADGAHLERWLADPAFASKGSGFTLNGIAASPQGELFVSFVDAAPELLRVRIGPDGAPGPISRIAFPRVLRNADALRFVREGALLIFESDAFGKDGPFHGAIALARISGDAATLTPLAEGLESPSSGAVEGGRIWFIESKYRLLLRAGPGEAVPEHVPFQLVARPFPDLH